MRTLRIYSVKEVASGLRKLGLKPLSVCPPDEMLDANIQVHDRVHIQVGEGYMIVTEVEHTHNAYILFPPRTTIPAVYKDAIKAIRRRDAAAKKLARR